MIGRVLGHYRILERIGAGGMGEVYRARDSRLERDVALKILPPGRLADETARRRFRKEAHALSRLSHPHVATVHDFDTQDGMDFLVMELIPGQGLEERLRSGPLPEKEVLRLGSHLASGLLAAHEHGVVHRDLKPSNLRLTEDGMLKILDFGLARVEAPVTEGSAPTETAELAFAGTVPYMAPEQLQGRSADPRTDIYAAGNVLYEMATGARPFVRAHGPVLTEAILHQAPPSPRQKQAVSPGLEFVILKALEKEPERRYQSAKELLLDLERLAMPSVVTGVPERARRRRWPVVVAAAAAVVLAVGGLAAWRLLRTAREAPIASLAVLPLKNFSGDPGQEFFADGMTDALIAGLAQIKALKVISHTSVMQYKEAGKPLPQIARELGVEGIVEGSVTRSGGRVRIAVQLIDARQDRHLWASNYEREMTDVLSLQSEVVRAIAGEIRAQVSPRERERLETDRRVDPRSYEAYLEGRFFLWNKATAPAVEKSIAYFRLAIERDPKNAPAYVGLVEAYGILRQIAAQPLAESAGQQRDAALRALEIDDTLADGHVALGGVKVEIDWDWEGGEREYQRAIELSPNHANAHLWYSQLLNWLGRHEEALAQIERARELDPLNPFIAVNWLHRLYYLRRHDQALAESRTLLEIHPDYWLNHWMRGALYLAKGMYEEAIVEEEKAVALSEGSLECLPDLGYAYARAGRTADALKVLDSLRRESTKRYVPAIFFARVYVGLGDMERAFAFMERAYEEHDFRLAWRLADIDPSLEALHSDPRFPDLRRRMRLPG